MAMARDRTGVAAAALLALYRRLLSLSANLDLGVAPLYLDVLRLCNLMTFSREEPDWPQVSVHELCCSYQWSEFKLSRNDPAPH
jgi:hypothetical protein